MIQLTKQQKIDFCLSRLNYDKSFFICLSLECYICEKLKLIDYNEVQCVDLLDAFEELKNNFPTGYDFKDHSNTICYHYRYRLNDYKTDIDKERKK